MLPPNAFGTEDRPNPQLGGGGSTPLDDDILNAFGMRRMRLGPGAGTGVAWGAGSITGNDAPPAGGTENNPADPERWRRGQDNNPYTSWQFQFSDDSSSSQGRSAQTYPPDADAARWRKGLDKVAAQVKELSRDTSAKLARRDRALDDTFRQIHIYVDSEVGGVNFKLARVQSLLEEQGQVLEDMREQIADQGRTITRGAVSASQFTNTTTAPQTFQSPAPPPPFNWDALDVNQQHSIVQQVIDQMDVTELAEHVGDHLQVATMRDNARDTDDRIAKLEWEFNTETGAVSLLQQQVAEWEARRHTSSVERGGYVFRDQADVEAVIVAAAGTRNDISKYFLDVISLLTLAKEGYSSYTEAVRVHADAIKAKFNSVLSSRMKLSFEIPFPEMVVKCVENTATAGTGGAKWGPMFATAQIFEDDFRNGAHRRVIKGIEKAYELMQVSVDTDFPLAHGTDGTVDMRKLNMIILDHNRRALRQTTGFIECLLPFYRTLSGGSLDSEEAWDRVFVFVMEFLTSVQERRVVSADVSAEAAMIWGSFIATDFAEEFRKQKYVEHPKALSIIALTSIEREGKALAEITALLESRDKDKADRKKDLEPRVQALENKMKNIRDKNPDLK